MAWGEYFCRIWAFGKVHVRSNTTSRAPPIHHLVDTNHTVLPRGSTTKLPQSAFALGAPGSTAPSFTEFLTHRLTTCCCFHYYYANAAATAFTFICLIWSQYFFWKKRLSVECSWVITKSEQLFFVKPFIRAPSKRLNYLPSRINCHLCIMLKLPM